MMNWGMLPRLTSPNILRRTTVCAVVLGAAIFYGQVGRALAAALRCPSYGCLDEQCELNDDKTTIESCSNALYADKQKIKFWLNALTDRKIGYPLYLSLTTPIEQHSNYATMILRVMRETMKENGKVCFEGEHVYQFVCKELTEPKGTAPFQRHY